MSANAILRSVTTVRRNNVARMIGPEGSFRTQVELANKLRVTQSYISQILSPRSRHRISEVTARKWEFALGLPRGALDLE